MTLQELIERLQAAIESGDEAGEQEATEALQQHAQPVYQDAFNNGHGTATRDGARRQEELEGQLEDARSEARRERERAEELEENAPDATEIRRQYEEQAEEMRAEHEQETQDLREQIRSGRMTTARQRLVSRLSSGNGDGRLPLDGDYADVISERHRDRLTFGDDGELQVLQQGRDIPVQVAAGEDPLDVLAGEIYEAAPAKFKVSGADRGSGSGSGGGSGGGSDGGRWDEIRKRAKKERESKSSGPSVEERLGIGS